jgi:hypothetical protein
MFDHHLHTQSWNERHQRGELRAELEGKNPFTDFDGSGLAEGNSARTGGANGGERG